MTSPKALIFDIDGTLWDSVALVGEGYNLQLIDDGHPELCISEARLRTLFGKTMVDLADGMLAGLPKEQRMDQMERCMDAFFCLQCRRCFLMDVSYLFFFYFLA